MTVAQIKGFRSLFALVQKQGRIGQKLNKILSAIRLEYENFAWTNAGPREGETDGLSKNQG